MKKIVSLLTAAVLLLMMAGCTEKDPAPTQESQQEQIEACKDLIEGGICLEQLEKPLQEMGYETIIQCLDWDDSVRFLEARLQEEGNALDRFEIFCYVGEDGKLLAIKCNQTVPTAKKDRLDEIFSQQVETSFGDLCKAAPAVAESFAKDYVPVPDLRYEKYRADMEQESYTTVPDVPQDKVALKFVNSKDYASFYYTIGDGSIF